MKLLSLSINGTPIPAPSGIPTEGLNGSGGKIIGFGLALFLIVAIVMALGFIVWGGLSWMWSEGDKTKVESSRRTIIYALFGLLICFLAFFVISFLGQVLKVDFFNLSLQ